MAEKIKNDELTVREETIKALGDIGIGFSIVLISLEHLQDLLNAITINKAGRQDEVKIIGRVFAQNAAVFNTEQILARTLDSFIEKQIANRQWDYPRGCYDIPILQKTLEWLLEEVVQVHENRALETRIVLYMAERAQIKLNLHLALSTCSCPAAADILIDAGANPNDPSYPLNQLSLYGEYRLAVLEVCLKRGGNPNLTDSEGRTSLDYAIWSNMIGREKVIQLIKSHGGEPGAGILRQG